MANALKTTNHALQFNNVPQALGMVTSSLQGVNSQTILTSASMLKLNANQLAVMLSASGMTEAEIAGILAARGYSQATAIAALKLLGLSDSQIAAAINMHSFSVSEGVAIGTTNGLTLSLNGLSAALKAVAQNPVTWILASLGALVAAIKLFDLTYDEASKTAKNSIQEYESITSEIENINSELDTTNDRISELKAKGSLTFVEAEELSSLQKAREELDETLAVQKELQNMAGEQAAEDAYKAIQKQNFSYVSNSDIVDEPIQYTSTNLLGMARHYLEIGDKDGLSFYMDDINTYYEILSKYPEKYADTLAELESIRNAFVGENVVKQRAIDAFLDLPSLQELVEQAKTAAEESNGIGTDFVEGLFDPDRMAEAASNAGMEIDEFVQGVTDTINSMAGTINADEVISQVRDIFMRQVPENIGMSDRQAWQDLWSQIVDGIDFDTIKGWYNLLLTNDTSNWTWEDFEISWDAYISGAEEATDATEEVETAAREMSDEVAAAIAEMRNNLLTSDFAKQMGGTYREALMSYGEAFDAWIGSLSDEDLEIVYQIYLDTSTADFTLDQWQDRFEDAKFASTLSSGIKDLQSGYKSLNELLAKLQSGTYTVQDLWDVVADFPELLNSIDWSNVENTEDLIVAVESAMDSLPDHFVENLEAIAATLSPENAEAVRGFIAAIQENPEAFYGIAESADEATEALEHNLEVIEEIKGALLKNAPKFYGQRYADFADEVQGAFDNYFDNLSDQAIDVAVKFYEEGGTENWNLGDWQENIEQGLISLSFDTFGKAADSIDSLSSALASLEENKMSVFDLVDLLGEFPDLLPYVDVGADGFGDLANGIKALRQAKLQSAVQDMIDFANAEKEAGSISAETANQILATADALGDISLDESSISGLTEGFASLADAIKGSQDAMEALDDALSSNNQAGYDKRVEAFEKVGEAFENQEVGSTADVWNWAQALGASQEVLDGYDPQKLYDWVQQVGPFFQEGTAGVDAFLTAIQGNEDALALFNDFSFDGDNLNFDIDNSKLKELGSILGLDEAAIYDLINAVGEYYNVQLQTPQDLITYMGELTTSADSVEQKMLNLKSALEQGLSDLGFSEEDIELAVETGQIEGATGDVQALLDAYNSAKLEIENSPIATEADDDLEVTFTVTVDDQQVDVQLTDTRTHIEEVLGEDFVANISGDNETLQISVEDATALLNSIPDHEVTITSDAGQAIVTCQNIIKQINAIPRFYNSVITVTTRKIEEKLAEGTRSAHGGTVLLGDEYSPNGTPKPELVVSGDGAYLAGINGPVIGHLNKGDVVYTASETKRILSSGGFSNEIPAFAAGGGSKWNGANSITGGASSSASSGSRSSSSGSSDNSSSNTEDVMEAIDWIEKAIDRMERKVEKLSNAAENASEKLATRTKANNKLIASTTSEIELQQKAYERYIQEADSVGLSSSLAKKVRNGTIDINRYDEETRELISSYEEWYEKALDCAGAIDTLSNSLGDLYKNNFDMVQQNYDDELSLIEHLANVYDNGIAMLEARGRLASAEYYTALGEVEKSTVTTLNTELSKLQKALDAAVSSGAVKKGSENWYAMMQEINGVKEAIDDARLSYREYANEIRKIKWDNFDYAEDRISQITAESEYLISLLSGDMVDERGLFTDEGNAALGLHGVNYDVLMAQANDYARAIRSADKAIAKDPYNTDLIARREELLKLQQQSIKAAEDEKQAMIGLVEDGIKVQLDSLKELITTYTDNLDRAKSLYDYQKKLGEQTANIANIQKQMAAYSGDTSEENRVRLQTLNQDLIKAQEELEESQYDQYIKDQKQLLDDLYLEYESVLNSRLDNVDALIESLIQHVNANSDKIYDTLSGVTSAVGYEMSSVMVSIWDTAKTGIDSVLAKYDHNYSGALTTVNSALGAIKQYVSAMKTSSANESATIIGGPSTNTGATPAKTTPATTPAAKATPSVPSTTPAKEKSTSKTMLTEQIKYGVAYAIWAANQGWGTGATRTNLLKEVFGDNNGIQAIVNQGYAAVVNYANKNKLNYADYSYAKMKNKFKAYRSGGIVDYTGLARVDGTPQKPEAFLSANDTQNMAQLLEALEKIEYTPSSKFYSSSGIVPFINNSKIDTYLNGKLGSLSDAYSKKPFSSVGEINVTIEIDHVQDYNDMLRQMQSDTKFERLINSLTLEKMINPGTLGKYTIKL